MKELLKKKTTKIGIAVVQSLALLIALTILSACGSNAEETSSNGESQETAENTGLEAGLSGLSG